MVPILLLAVSVPAHAGPPLADVEVGSGRHRVGLNRLTLPDLPSESGAVASCRVDVQVSPEGLVVEAAPAARPEVDATPLCGPAALGAVRAATADWDVILHPRSRGETLDLWFGPSGDGGVRGILHGAVSTGALPFDGWMVLEMGDVVYLPPPEVPRSVPAGSEAQCSVKLHADEEGRITDVTVTECGGAWAEAVAKSSRRAKVRPTRVDGEAVPAQHVRRVRMRRH